MSNQRNSGARERDRDDRQPDPRTASADAEERRRMSTARGHWANRAARQEGEAR